MNFWIYIDGEVSDRPYKVEELVELENFDLSTMVCLEDSEEWVEARKYSEITSELKPAGPEDPEAEISEQKESEVTEHQSQNRSNGLEDNASSSKESAQSSEELINILESLTPYLTPQNVTLFGSIALFIGAFLPVFEVPVVGGITLLNISDLINRMAEAREVSEMAGMAGYLFFFVFLISGVVSFTLSLYKKFKAVFPFALISGLFYVIMVFRLFSVLGEGHGMPGSVISMVSWAWGVLLVGIVGLAYASWEEFSDWLFQYKNNNSRTTSNYEVVDKEDAKSKTRLFANKFINEFEKLSSRKFKQNWEEELCEYFINSEMDSSLKDKLSKIKRDIRLQEIEVKNEEFINENTIRNTYSDSKDNSVSLTIEYHENQMLIADVGYNLSDEALTQKATDNFEIIGLDNASVENQKLKLIGKEFIKELSKLSLEKSGTDLEKIVRKFLVSNNNLNEVTNMLNQLTQQINLLDLKLERFENSRKHLVWFFFKDDQDKKLAIELADTDDGYLISDFKWGNPNLSLK